MADSYIPLPDGTKLQSDAILVGPNTVHRQKGYFPDGVDEAQGAKADTLYSDGTGAASGSVIALLKGLFVKLAGTLTTKQALGTTTITTPTAGTSSSSVIAANTSRKSLRIVNPTSATITVFLGIGTAATTSSPTFLLPGDSYFEDKASDQIFSITASGTQALTVYEVA